MCLLEEVSEGAVTGGYVLGVGKGVTGTNLYSRCYSTVVER